MSNIPEFKDLLDESGSTCVLMEKERVPDGEGGNITVWKEGIQFTNYQALDTSMEARIAEKQGVTSTYSALVDRDFPIYSGDAFKDLETGHTYRVTSDPDDKKAAESSTMPYKYFTAERWELPK